MRGWFAAALAIGLAVAPGASLAAQATHGKHTTTRTERQRRARRTITPVSTADESARASATTRLRLWTRGATLLATRLEHKQESTPEQMHSDANALGRDIADARAALEQLRKLALPAEKPRLDSVRGHLNEARKRYGDVAKALPDPDKVAAHAAEVRQQLAAAQTALGGSPGRPAAKRSSTKPARRSVRRSRTSSKPRS